MFGIIVFELATLLNNVEKSQRDLSTNNTTNPSDSQQSDTM